MLVIDASAVVELLLARPAAAAVERVVREHDFALHAPHLIDVEVLSALRRLVASGDATVVRAAEAVDDLLDLPLERYAHELLIPRMWELRDNFSTYDATYLALAEAVTERGASLLTADARFARAVEARGDVRVHLAD
jgi:predicted nucleic acid-binding protein